MRQAQHFNAELRTSTEMAKQNGNIACFSFDFEQNFPLPHIPIDEIFYLRQIWLYVFGIHVLVLCTAGQRVWLTRVQMRCHVLITISSLAAYLLK